MYEEEIPEMEAGTTIPVDTSNFVAPSPYPACRRSSGTALIASSEIDDTIGIVMIPTMIDAESALNVLILGNSVAFSAGVMYTSAKYPYTTVGMPARISKSGLSIERAFEVAYSLR